jgi:hypothetical protein
MATAVAPDAVGSKNNVIPFPTPVDNINSHQLASQAMLVELHLSAWKAQRLDRRITEEVLTERKAEKDAGRFEKHLIPPKALEPVSKAHTKARTRHYLLTLPWGENGVRILSSAAFFEYTKAMTEERSSCEAEHRAFIARYPDLLAEAPTRLGAQLYNPRDFPRVDLIEQKFRFQLEIMPVPEKDDFRVQLGSATEERIRSSIETTIKERYTDAQRELWERLLDTVKHFAITMKEEKKIFRDTTVTKLADLARVAPKLSLTPDPKLDEMCAQILSITNSVDPNVLRENKAMRRDTAQSAMDAVKQIESAMAGAF